MLNAIITASARNRFLVIMATVMITVAGYYIVKHLPLDAIPDLSDVQVIIYTDYPGQTPQVVEDQVTYPLATAMLAVPKAKNVRGYSFFGTSFVYIIFEEGTDLYWARSRTLEYLNGVAGRLPAAANPVLGPDATGVGWVYEYAVVDRSGKHDLAQLRSLQDWFLRYELQTVPGVAEVASVGGFVKQYQVEVDPNKLSAYGIPLMRVTEAIKKSNQDVDGRLLEMAETEFMVRSFGYIRSPEDLRRVTIGSNESGTPIYLGDVANITIGPELRRGVAELDGEGETVGGVVVMRFGENALRTIELVREKIERLRGGLPEGVEIVETYDRSALILRAVEFLKEKLVEESVIVALVCMVFLMHLRSSFVAILTLPLGALMALMAISWMGINANIMSLGGIAIAIGAMIDASVVMIENAHKKLEAEGGKRPRADIMIDAAKEVGPALFFCLMIITISFLPVFTLEDQEGRLFKPLAYTKTFAMASAAILAITLTPALMVYFIRGGMVPERMNPLTLAFIALVRPVTHWALNHKGAVLAVTLAAALATWLPLTKVGGEFMPTLDEGDILYMPTTLPGVSVTKAREILQHTDRILRTFPEVERVFGKAGRAETATDPAPLSMIETIVKLKPRAQWRPGVTTESLMAEMEGAIRFPGVTNAWTMPIKTRIDMLSTGIRTPVGIKVAGPDLAVVDTVAVEIESALRGLPGLRSVFADRALGGSFLDIRVRRGAAARYGLNVGDVQEVIASAIGGMTIGYTVEGRERYPINVRYGREMRDDVERLRRTLVSTMMGAQVPLAQLADIELTSGPMMIKTEDARLNTWIYVDIEGMDMATFVAGAKARVAERVKLPSGVSLKWSGQYESMERVTERLKVIVPLTLAVIFILLYLNFRAVTESLLVMLMLPLSAIGGLYLMWWLGYHFSVAVGVGFIALAGVAAEIGVLKLVYINLAVERRRAAGRWNTVQDAREATLEGVIGRVRPIMMTTFAILGGLAPIMFGEGAGAEVMRRIAAPMVGGMVSVTLLSLIALPALYCTILEYRVTRKGADV
ncbi:MAG: efflux RND transporter permease subunit [Nitrospinae bacterium]|nr:efflux RND transporter permease subunit [Nitrospinota bacterium]